MKLLEGKTLAERIIDQIKQEIKTAGLTPGLAVILVGEDPASKLYVRNKEKACNKVGIYFHKYIFPADCPEKHVFETIKFLNQDEDVQGIIVQLPLPPQFNSEKVVNAILPSKDIDGFHQDNLKKLFSGQPAIISPTVQAVLTLLESTRKDFKRRKTIILANSEIFSRPLKYLLDQKGLKTEVVFSKEKDWPNQLGSADLLVIALGQPRIIKSQMLKRGATVIDVGTTYLQGKLVGDVDLEEVKDQVDLITPVPGGVGPLTVAYLLKNLINLALNKKPTFK